MFEIMNNYKRTKGKRIIVEGFELTSIGYFNKKSVFDFIPKAIENMQIKSFPIEKGIFERVYEKARKSGCFRTDVFKIDYAPYNYSFLKDKYVVFAPSNVYYITDKHLINSITKKEL